MDCLLPVELLDCVAKELTEPRDLLGFLRASRACRGAAEMQLYRRVQVDSSIRAPLLVETLLANPTLRPLVQSLTISRPDGQALPSRSPDYSRARIFCLVPHSLFSDLS